MVKDSIQFNELLCAFENSVWIADDDARPLAEWFYVVADQPEQWEPVAILKAVERKLASAYDSDNALFEVFPHRSKSGGFESFSLSTTKARKRMGLG